MQPDFPDLSLFYTILKILSALAIISSWMASTAGLLLYRRVTNKKSILWILTFIMPFILPLTVYLTEKIANKICKNKHIESRVDLGISYMIFYVMEFLLLTGSTLRFALLNSPSMDDLKILITSCAAALILRFLATSFSCVQLFFKNKAIGVYLVKRKKEKTARL